MARTWTVAQPTVVDIDQSVTRLEATLVRGRIDIVAAEGPGTPGSRGARVEVHALTGRPLEVSLAGSTLKVGYPTFSVGAFVDKLRSFHADESADVQITVPADVALKLAVIAGDGLVAGLRGEAKVSTVTGPVVVDQCTGDLKLSTVSGEGIVRDHTGDVVASTVSGPLTVSGEVAQAKVSTVSGDLTLDLVAAPHEAKVSSVSGDVVVRTPDVDRLRMRLSAASGRVLVAGVEHHDPRHKGISLDVGDPVGTLVLSAVSGDLTVLTAGEQPGPAGA